MNEITDATGAWRWIVERDDSVAVLRYDGSPRRTLSIAGAQAAGDLVEERASRARPPVLVFVLDILHAELAEVREMSEGRPIADWAPWVRAIDAVERYPNATIVAAAAQLSCGGLELALAADIRVAAATARLGLLETRMGIMPGAGGTQRLPELVGAGNAALMVLAGQPVSGTEAHRIGLVQLLDDDPVTRATNLAEELASIGPDVIAAAKRALAAGRVRSPDGFRTEGRSFLSVVGTPDTKRRMDHWLECQRAGANPALDPSSLP